jgi:hypothetical protein
MGKKSGSAAGVTTRAAAREGGSQSQHSADTSDIERASSQFEVDTLTRILRRIEQVNDAEIRSVLAEWMETEIDDDLAEDLCRLSETLPAALLFSLSNIRSAALFFLVRDILGLRGHDISDIKTRAVREGVAKRLYADADGDGMSAELDLANAVITRYERDREWARQQIMLQTLIPETTRGPAEVADKKMRRVWYQPRMLTSHRLRSKGKRRASGRVYR